jgi:Spy/CpxP family protein refolding chaperone
MTARVVVTVFAALALFAPAVVAQDQPAIAEDPLFSTLFAPELIMQHRRAIGLTDEQRDAISQMIQDLQGRVVRLQWELLDEVERLTEITSATRIDLDRSLDQVGRVLDTENEIKRAHLEMLVRIKNLLTPEQQTTLERLREGAGEPPGGT